MIILQQWRPDRTDPAATQQHLQLLSATMSATQIAQIAHLDRTTVSRLPSAVFVSRRVAAAIQSIPIPLSGAEIAADNTRVPILGATRRIQSLIAFGHTPCYLRRRLRVSCATMRQLTSRPVRNSRNRGAHISVALHRRVHTLWSELQMQPGQSTTARQTAARHRWALPFMWDEADLDDPTAKPIPCRRTRTTNFRDRRDERIHQVVAATERGEGSAEIAARLGTTERTVCRVRAEARHRGLLGPVTSQMTEAAREVA
ncbi:hypothetical protein [Nocardia sp. NPDC051570]|uniref:hypothetical protein n=1 Tax=Nocardia sp. NPDC051570 TaxID=3364324 RepID=UPI0037B220F8